MAVLMLLCAMAVPALCADNSEVKVGPSFRGTINIVEANDQGMVVLTDSMLTETRQNATGVRTSRQIPTPGQKLFRIDDQTVCAFAGFASADTPPLPDFLNSVSAIIGRYQDRLRHTEGPLSVSDKLELLEGIFNNYITGIANIREGSNVQDYSFELLLAGYDPDGTPEIGRLVLDTAPEHAFAGTLLRSVTKEHSVIPIGHRQIICVNGISDIALEMLNRTNAWEADPALAACEQSTKDQKLLSIEEMRALAISLKERTADRYKEVGGPNQIAVLTHGHVLQPLEQPPFPSVSLSRFKFMIVANVRIDGRGSPGVPASYGVVRNGPFGLYFRNEFVHVRQILDNSYYGRNLFKDCVLVYGGDRAQFEKSNEVIDSDLEIAAGVRRNSPEVRQLLGDFRWRTVKYLEDSQVGAK
jgi:20S proteasome alpha/beta subunit